MFVYLPSDWNKLLLITDRRMAADAQYDRHTGASGNKAAVLRGWGFKGAVRGTWAQTGRVALFEYDDKLEVPEHFTGQPLKARRTLLANRKAKAREALAALLRKIRPACTVVLQSRSSRARDSQKDNASSSQTVAWPIFDAPGSITDCAGCVHASPYGPVVALPHPANGEFVHHELTRRWLERAYLFASGRQQLERPSTYIGQELEPAQKALSSIQGASLVSVDLETFVNGETITAIGLSDGTHAISVPWDSFQPHGRDYIEHGAGDPFKAAVKNILASHQTKTMHNGVAFDVPFLQGLGIPVNGPLLDTMLMHGVVYPQYRHGLQHAVSSCLPCPPWKTEHLKGKQASDPHTWIQNPQELRSYNCSDAFYGHKLCTILRKELNL